VITDPNTIPYNEAELDPEIVELCRVVNSSFLFRTTSSCAGHHQPGFKGGQVGANDAFVVFVPVSDDLQARQHFLERIVKACVGQPWWCELHGGMAVDAEGNVHETWMLSLMQPAWKTKRPIEAKKQALAELPRIIRQGA
jgi:hypothetical protein